MTTAKTVLTPEQRDDLEDRLADLREDMEAIQKRLDTALYTPSVALTMLRNVVNTKEADMEDLGDEPHRYYSIYSPQELTKALESLQALAPAEPSTVTKKTKKTKAELSGRAKKAVPKKLKDAAQRALYGRRTGTLA